MKKNTARRIDRRIDDLGRIVIPKDIRKELGIAIGESLDINIEDGKIIIQKIEEK